MQLLDATLDNDAGITFGLAQNATYTDEPIIRMRLDTVGLLMRINSIVKAVNCFESVSHSSS